MRFYYLTIPITLLVYSCANNYKGYKLSTFTINSKYKNSKIIGRHPDYGDGHKDGCIITSEMMVDIITSNKGTVSGLVRDINSKAPLSAASIKLFDKSDNAKTLLTDNDGKFIIGIEGALTRLEVTYLGYRGFVVEL